MSCYHPNVVIKSKYTRPDGKHSCVMISQVEFVTKYNGELRSNAESEMLYVPCGKCVGCRLDNSRQWADRMVLELDHSSDALFITLTYDNENIPVGGFDIVSGNPYFSLFKRDITLFLKRLRKAFSNKQIRYFYTGEYGTHTFRPHYHFILYGLKLSDFYDVIPRGFNEFHQPYYSSEWLSSIWSKGMCCIAPVSWRTCAYVARYTLKKLEHDGFDPSSLGIVPEYSEMSRRPGIAGYYHIDHPECFELSEVPISNSNDVSTLTPINFVRLPKYNLSKLELINPELFANIKEQRREAVNDNMMIKLMNTDLSWLQLLEVEENEKLKKSKCLVRPNF